MLTPGLAEDPVSRFADAPQHGGERRFEIGRCADLQADALEEAQLALDARPLAARPFEGAGHADRCQQQDRGGSGGVAEPLERSGTEPDRKQSGHGRGENDRELEPSSPGHERGRDQAAGQGTEAGSERVAGDDVGEDARREDAGDRDDGYDRGSPAGAHPA
jgi:hypothetical protein